MPFIAEEARKSIAAGKLAETPGEVCYLFYQDFVLMWGRLKRWTTVHQMLKMKSQHIADVLYEEVSRSHLDAADAAVAWELAWKEFYDRHIRPYEDQKLKENGDIK